MAERFTDLQDVNDYSYSYNPCQGFVGDTPGGCSSVHVREHYSINYYSSFIDTHTHMHTHIHTHTHMHTKYCDVYTQKQNYAHTMQSFADMSGGKLCSRYELRYCRCWLRGDMDRYRWNTLPVLHWTIKQVLYIAIQYIVV